MSFMAGPCDRTLTLHSGRIATLGSSDPEQAPLFCIVREWDGPAVLPPLTALRVRGGLEARGAHRYVP